MPTTTFAGPVKAGGISTSTGNILGENVANQGFAKMVQVAAISQASGDPVWTDIVIPANSQIIRMAVLITTAGDTHVISVGRDDSVGSADNWFASTAPATTVGLKEIEGTQVIDASRWKDTGDIDCHITYYWTNAGSNPGRATLIVEYVQNRNLTA